MAKIRLPVERQEYETEKGKPRSDIEFRRGWNACRRVMGEHYEKLWREKEALVQQVADLEANAKEQQRLKMELAGALKYDAPTPSMCDLVLEAKIIAKEYALKQPKKCTACEGNRHIDGNQCRVCKATGVEE